MTSVSLCAAAAAVLGAVGLAAPAMASTGPSMTVNGNSVNIAIQGPHNSLKFYWAVNGTATWHAETIAGPGTTFSAPSMTVNGNSVEDLLTALHHANRIIGQPKVLVCYTSMGKGVALIERRSKAHFIRVEPEEWDLTLRQLDEGGL